MSESASETCKNAPMLDWQDLRYFLAVAQHGSLTAAARVLGVDHATVGRRIAHLEATTGLKLIDRLPRATRLTVHGQSLAEAAKAMERGAEGVHRHLRGKSTGLSGSVVVSALPVISAFVIARSLSQLRLNHPDLQVVLLASSSVASLEKGEADLSLGFVRPRAEGRIVREMGLLPLALYAASSLADMAIENQSFIGFEQSFGHIEQQRWLEDVAGSRPFALRTNDVVTQHQAARAGLGLALLPCLLGDADEGLVRVAVGRATPSRQLWLSVHADIRKSPAVRAVMDHLIETFK
ncbi:LysR family transcriptional regulator [Agrobacterium vitis]|uniref:LysR family transcriptional regulator n=1 Tax=Agrobacterium vitis TaxID=373 RepID=UPI001F1EFE0B|nr:LysR family transcriptional regulator [Agrobacterium vitis]